MATATVQQNMFEPAGLGPAHLATAHAALKFMLAGNATVTLKSAKTGTRFTFSIKKKDDQFRDIWFVNLLSGPDNENDYRYIGLISDGGFYLTKKSKVTADAPSYIAFKYAFNKLWKGVMPVSLEVWHEGRCGRCNRKLTVPESIALGLGPECAGRMM